MKAMLFAAGKGTRLKPFTDFHPKPLALVNGVSLLERNIKYLKSFGVNQFVINIHHFGEQIVEFLEKNKNFDVQIEISDERNELLETGGGLLFAREKLENEPFFIVMNADILTNLDVKKMVDYHLHSKKMVTMAVSDRESSRKLFFDEQMLLKGWVNKKENIFKMVENASSHLRELAFSGIHCISSEIFSKINRTGCFSIMDEYLDFMKEDLVVGYEHFDYLIDVGKKDSIQKAEQYFK